MNEKIEIIKASEFGLDENKAIEIQKSFSPVIAEREALTELYNAIIVKELSPELCSEAASLRKKLVKVRTGTAKIHKAEKGFFLAAGRFVDAWKNKNTIAVELMESKLSEIENYYINLEKKKQAELQSERASKLMSFEVENIPENLGIMGVEMWDAYILGVEQKYNAKIQAEKEAEEKRIAEEKAEKERIAKIEAENLRLQKEAQEKERKRLAELKAIEEKQEKERLEREKLEAEKQAKIDAERKELERLAEIERKKQAEILEAERKKAQEKARIEAEKQAKIQADLEAKAKAERLAREKLQAEKDAKEKAEAASILLAKEKAEKELQKGDVEKFETLIADLTELKTKYSFESELNKNKMTQTATLLDKIINYITK